MSPAGLESKAKAFHAVRPSANLVDRQFRREWRFAVGTCVLAWFPDQGWWPSVVRFSHLPYFTSQSLTATRSRSLRQVLGPGGRRSSRVSATRRPTSSNQSLQVVTGTHSASDPDITTDHFPPRRWALPTDIRELPHKCPPPTHWRLGNKVSTNDAKLWKSAVHAATFRPAELKAWLELSTHYEDGLQKKVAAAGKAAAKRASTAK